jgi:hypothetical protein
MQRIPILRVEAPAATFEPLFAAAAARRERLGWLDFETTVELADGLGEAARAGARPAVAVGNGQVIAVRVMRGAPVLRDLLRRDFLGCRAVLVRGELEAPLLSPEPGGWRVSQDAASHGPEGGAQPAAASRSWTSTQLLDALRRPRPWG